MFDHTPDHKPIINKQPLPLLSHIVLPDSDKACQLETAGEDVRLLILLDSHAIANEELRKISGGMPAEINRDYFETSPLFADLRESGMLEAMIKNAAHTSEDMVNHTPLSTMEELCTLNRNSSPQRYQRRAADIGRK